MRFRIAEDPSKFVGRLTLREAQRGLGRGGAQIGYATIDTSIVSRQLQKLRSEQESRGARGCLQLHADAA